jgi:hypothetical protein
MKIKTTVMSLFVMLFIPALTYADHFEEYRAVELQLKGRSTAPDITDVAVVRQTMGSMIEDLWVQKYVVKAWDSDGGFAVCLERSPFAQIGDILSRLNTITINPESTHLKFKPIENCD